MVSGTCSGGRGFVVGDDRNCTSCPVNTYSVEGDNECKPCSKGTDTNKMTGAQICTSKLIMCKYLTMLSADHLRFNR